MIYSGGNTHEKGVGVLLDMKTSRSLLGYWTISERVMLVKLKGKCVNISIVQGYAPTSNSTEDEIDLFYEEIDKAKDQCGAQDVVIFMGEFNAKVGQQAESFVVGKYGLGNRNERGSKLIDWCQANEHVIANTWFCHHPRRRWTWKSPGDNTRNQIDYITISRRYRNAIKQAKSHPGADCGSDHVPVICTLKVKIQRLKKGNTGPRLDFDQLSNNADIRREYAISVKNRYDVLKDEGQATWEAFKESLTTTAKDMVPKKDRVAKSKWMIQEIIDLIQARRKVKRNGEEYQQLDAEIKQKCKTAKEEWLESLCTEIEHKIDIKPADMYRKIKDISGMRVCSSSGCIKSKEGSLLMDKEAILERWSE